MKTIITKLIQLADGLDGLGLKKDADLLDQVITKTAAGEDFGDLMKLFDEPVEFDDEAEEMPGKREREVEEPEIYTPLDEKEAPLDIERPKKITPGLIGEDEAGNNLYMIDKSQRLDELKRRNELMRLKKLIEKAEMKEDKEDLDAVRNRTPDEESDLAAEGEDYVNRGGENWKEDESFEDEEVNEDDDGLFSQLKEKLKSAPDLLMKILQVVKDNPELLELLAL